MDESLSESASDEALLEHWSWVRRLAGQLVRDPEGRDEVVQQTWLVALEKRPQATNLRAWLRRVVQRTAHHRYRSDARRASHERAARTLADVPDPAELAAQAERWHGLVGAIARLDEPYRSTILLRFYRDMSPRDIARSLDLPAATVRSRLKRGLDQLRSMLDREHDGNRAAWRALLAPAAAMASGSVLAAGTGALLMGTKAKVAVACLVIAATVVTWTVVSDSSERSPSSDRDPSRSAASLPEVASRSSDVEDLGLRSVAEDRIEVFGSVVDPDGKPIARATVKFIEASADGRDERLHAEGVTDAVGEFRVDAVVARRSPDSRLSVVARADGYRADLASVELGTATNVTLPWRAVISGTVRDATTQDPIPDAEIRINNRECVSDSSGWYSAGDLQTGVDAYWEVTRRGYVEASGKLRMATSRETLHDFELVPGHALWITVVDEESGEAVAGAKVLNFNRQRTIGDADADGRIALYVDNGSSINVRFGAEGYAETVWHYEVRDALSMPTPRIPLRRLAWVEGVVADRDGMGLANAGVRAVRTAHRDGRVPMEADELREYGLPGYAYFHSPFATARTRSDGSFELTLAPADVVTRIEARLEGYAASGERSLKLDTPGQRKRLDFVLHRGAIVRGRALRNGAPWRGTVLCERLNGDRIATARTSDDGSYELRDVPPGPARLRVSGYALGRRPDPLACSIEPGGVHEHDIVWDEVLATIVGRVTRPSGDPVPDVEIYARDWVDGTSYSTRTRTSASGTYVLSVPPGAAYTVGAFDEPARIERHDIASGSTDIDFVMAARTTLRLELRDAETGQPAADAVAAARMGWRSSGEDELRRVRFEGSIDGTLTAGLPAGQLDISLTFGETGYERVDLAGVRVEESGEPVVVHLDRGAEVFLEFRNTDSASSEALSRAILFALRDDQLGDIRGPFDRQGPHSNWVINGTVLWVRDPCLRHLLLDIDQRGTARLTGLREGSYTLWSASSELRFEPASFTVDDDGGAMPVTIEWSIR